jgi:hypothetical protein
MERRLHRHSSIQASERSARFNHGESMEPKSPPKRKDPDQAALPVPLSPVNSEDYFELAYETDEFGVHVHEYLAAR